MEMQGNCDDHNGHLSNIDISGSNPARGMDVRGPFERLVDWRQCAAVMQREAVIVMSSCNGWGKVVVALSSFL
jgi:hypothetical protein